MAHQARVCTGSAVPGFEECFSMKVIPLDAWPALTPLVHGVYRPLRLVSSACTTRDIGLKTKKVREIEYVTCVKDALGC